VDHAALERPLRAREARLVRQYAHPGFASLLEEVETDWDALERELGGD
jgi:hypothetical protein